MAGPVPRDNILLDAALSPLLTLVNGAFGAFCDYVATRVSLARRRLRAMVMGQQWGCLRFTSGAASVSPGGLPPFHQWDFLRLTRGVASVSPVGLPTSHTEIPFHLIQFAGPREEARLDKTAGASFDVTADPTSRCCPRINADNTQSGFGLAFIRPRGLLHYRSRLDLRMSSSIRKMKVDTIR